MGIGGFAAAETAQAAASIHFTQCLNDTDNNDVKDDCEWAEGSANHTRAIYHEGDAVPQRLFMTFPVAGPNFVDFDYDFTKKDVYAYDFLTNVDATQTSAPVDLLNPCGHLPSFVTVAACGPLFSGSALVAIPSDPFQGVGVQETAGRNLRIAGATGATVDVEAPPAGLGHTAATTCFRTCGTSVVRVRVSFTTPFANSLVGLWFGVHLAAASGWGPGFGAAAVSGNGSPFHVTLGPGGQRTNQLQLRVVVPSDPPPEMPEAPIAVLLPASAAAVGVATLATLRRRSRRRQFVPGGAPRRQ